MTAAHLELVSRSLLLFSLFSFSYVLGRLREFAEAARHDACNDARNGRRKDRRA